VLDLFGLDAGTALRWGEPAALNSAHTHSFVSPKELV
jgi:hypothetical protein